jgi:Na+/H+ antiporter NhaD/arsenite permease-like protein
VTHAAVRRAHTPVGLLGLIIVAAGVLSALFVNDVVCLVMAPIVATSCVSSVCRPCHT